MRMITATALLLAASLCQGQQAPIASPTGVPTAGPAAAASMPINDPLLQRYGSWGQDYRDQWGLFAVDLLSLDRGTLSVEYVKAFPASLEPVVVAVIDSGIDYTHPDLAVSQLWRNPGERANGQDDDGNGLIDDLIGWNFVDPFQPPWDDHGHGTHVAGVIAANANNARGIAGIAPNARLMVLKALDGSGHGSGSDIARAIGYAVSQGARIIHLSLGGQAPGAAEREALQQALNSGVLVVTAAGNQADGDDRKGYESLPSVLVVGSHTPDGQRAGYSNWGPSLDLLAPGVEILSLRARGSDFLRRNGRDDYQPQSAVVEGDYYRATGNSFAAPFVTGVAALLLGRSPWLTSAQLQQLLLQSATDLGPEGIDQNHGYGRLNAAAALAADPQHYIDARLTAAVLEEDQTISLQGTADADRFRQAYLEYGVGEEPLSWQPLAAPIRQPLRGQALQRFSPKALPGGLVSLRLTVEHQDGGRRSSRLLLQLPN